jgi:hypothetical protein
MTFINEKISREDSIKVNWEQFPDYQQTQGYHRFIELPSRWTIDRDRKAFFWDIERPSPEIQFYKFGLYWKNELIVMNAQIKFKEYPKVENKLVDVFWRVFFINIPKSLNAEQSVVFGLIKEAFEAYGFLQGILPCGDVLVVFIHSPFSKNVNDS